MDSKLKWTLLTLLVTTTVSFQALAATQTESVRASGALGSVGSEPAKIKSYREWKSEKVQEAISHVTMTKTQIQISKNKDPNLGHQKSLESGPGLAIDRLEAQLEADQNVLETAKNFSVTDYLAGYLMKIQNKKAAFNEVAGKLTADEIAELMSAYANSAFGSHGSDMAPSANNAAEDRVR